MTHLIYIMYAHARRTILRAAARALCTPQRALPSTAILLMAASLTACLASCADTDSPADTDPAALTPITAHAAAPGTWGTVTRGFNPASGLNSLKLYYPAATDGSLKSYSVADANITHAAAADAAFSFTTEGDATASVPPLYWQQIAGKGQTAQTLYLTASKVETVGNTVFGNPLWAATTFAGVSAADAPRPELDFSTAPMKSRRALLTLVIKTKGTMDASRFAAFVFAKEPDYDAAVSAEGIKHLAYPTTGDAVKKDIVMAARTSGTSVPAEVKEGKWLAPQPVPSTAAGDAAGKQMLVIAYNTAAYNGTSPATSTGIASGNISYSDAIALWTLDLSQVKVTRPANSEYAAQGTAFRYNANEHITLTVSISLIKGSTPGTIVIDDYEAVADDWGSFDAPVGQ